ncbi:putative threonine--tRNA ligase 2, cytoplasmic, partial [Takifugu flavidus]
MERLYGGCLCYGPPIENGFYYDMFLDEEFPATDFGDLETLCRSVLKEKQSHSRVQQIQVSHPERESPHPHDDCVQVWPPDRPVQRPPRQTHGQDQVSEDLQELLNLLGGPLRHGDPAEGLRHLLPPPPEEMKEWERFQEEAKNRDHRKMAKGAPRVPGHVGRVPAEEPRGFLGTRDVSRQRSPEGSWARGTCPGRGGPRVPGHGDVSRQRRPRVGFPGRGGRGVLGTRTCPAERGPTGFLGTRTCPAEEARGFRARGTLSRQRRPEGSWARGTCPGRGAPRVPGHAGRVPAEEPRGSWARGTCPGRGAPRVLGTRDVSRQRSPEGSWAAGRVPAEEARGFLGTRDVSRQRRPEVPGRGGPRVPGHEGRVPAEEARGFLGTRDVSRQRKPEGSWARGTCPAAEEAQGFLGE